MKALGVSTGNPVVALSGEIDLATAAAVGASLEPWVRAGGPVILDLSDVTFMDSTGLHALVKAAKELGDRGCIIIHGAHGALWTILQLSQLGRVENMHFIECTVLVPA
jgi:anti-sigma B factor antagonist